MFFLTKAHAPDELLGSIRVVVVGEPLTGKTALTELIASGRPGKTSGSTAGCHIHVKLVHNQASDAAAAADRRFFVELWDVSGQPKYEQLRSVFYKQINGVILVYNVANKATLSKLPRWATEVCRNGSFLAPFSNDQAARNIGGLPVPVLLIGNKADRLQFGAADASSLSNIISDACSHMLSGRGCSSSWWRRSLSRLRGRQTAATDSSSAVADTDQHLKGLTASAITGMLDVDALNSYFVTLWERQYKPLTGGGHEYMHRNASFVGGLQGGLGAASVSMSLAGGRDSKDQRLDDEWV
eukprot:GHRR01009222.1.p1 GENE.GHRR01009222.1~~GHRR01009222.1.p1  ORF type:complete len:298 (+),score=88.10 GHRR01009222.1:707-1600(+)